jgi:hypothetical protein
MQMKSAFLALALAVGAAPLSAQIVARNPSPRSPRTGPGTGTIGDIIFGRGTADTTQCRVRDAVTPDGRVVQICDDQRAQKGRRHGDDDDEQEARGCGAQSDCHVNDRDGDGDFDANDRAIRKREHELAKQQRKAAKQHEKAGRERDD